MDLSKAPGQIEVTDERFPDLPEILVFCKEESSEDRLQYYIHDACLWQVPKYVVMKWEPDRLKKITNALKEKAAGLAVEVWLYDWQIKGRGQN